jgi:hypothetical protein
MWPPVESIPQIVWSTTSQRVVMQCGESEWSLSMPAVSVHFGRRREELDHNCPWASAYKSADTNTSSSNSTPQMAPKNLHNFRGLLALISLSIHVLRATSTLLPSCPHKSDADYDFVVVGSGVGGGPLAARLAENGFSGAFTQLPSQQKDDGAVFQCSSLMQATMSSTSIQPSRSILGVR